MAILKNWRPTAESLDLNSFDPEARLADIGDTLSSLAPEIAIGGGRTVWKRARPAQRARRVLVLGGLGAIAAAVAWRYRATVLEAVDRGATAVTAAARDLASDGVDLFDRLRSRSAGDNIEPEDDVDLQAFMSSVHAPKSGAARPAAASTATFEDAGVGDGEGAGSLVGADTTRA